MTMETDRISREELPECVSISVANLMDMVLNQRRTLAQVLPVTGDLTLNGFDHRAFLSQKRTKGMMEIEVRKLFRIFLSSRGPGISFPTQGAIRDCLTPVGTETVGHLLAVLGVFGCLQLNSQLVVSFDLADWQ